MQMSSNWLKFLLNGKRHTFQVIYDSLPDDAELVQAYMENDLKRCILVFRSDSFDDIQEYQDVPELRPKIQDFHEGDNK